MSEEPKRSKIAGGGDPNHEEILNQMFNGGLQSAIWIVDPETGELVRTSETKREPEPLDADDLAEPEYVSPGPRDLTIAVWLVIACLVGFAACEYVYWYLL